MTVTFLMIARIPAGNLALFEEYEAAVLRALPDFGGRLERRLRTPDDRVEAHLVTFADAAAFEAYRANPARQAAAVLLELSGAAVELLPVRDVA